MALMRRTEVGLKDRSIRATVPPNPKAMLMYYLSCMRSVLQMDDEDVDFNRLTNYREYSRLRDSDTDLLIMLGLALKPELLLNKCIFKDDAMCGDMDNKFFDIEAVSNNMLVAGSVVVAGRTKRVSKIMTFKRSWLQKSWINPMKVLIEEQERKGWHQLPGGEERNLLVTSCE